MRDPIEKASVLLEALPYIRRFAGSTFVIKYGGHAMAGEAEQQSFARDIALLKFVGIHPVVVHGGGPQIDSTLGAMGITSERVDGLRVTDEPTMRIAEMVLCGEINGQLTSRITLAGGRAVGLSGRDDRFLIAKKAPPARTKKGDTVDLGRVGEIQSVNVELMAKLIAGGFIPVVAPIAVDPSGEPLNVNADLVASQIAGALSAEKLVLMTDIEGVRGPGGKLAPALSRSAIDRYLEEGVISGGMIPKVRCALEALSFGVRKVHIVDGRVDHSILLEIFTDSGVGTEITEREDAT